MSKVKSKKKPVPTNQQKPSSRRSGSPTVPRQVVYDGLMARNLLLLDTYPFFFKHSANPNVRCLVCNSEFRKRFKYVKKTGCTVCASKESKGAIAIREFLERHNMTFTPEYKFADCKDKAPLPFDFAVMDSGRLILLVEFDGMQHYKPVKRFGGEAAFISQQRRDKIKNEYCLKNNIPLLRIKYNLVKSIDEILTNNEYIASLLSLSPAGASSHVSAV